jgi:hypothetical protein
VVAIVGKGESPRRPQGAGQPHPALRDSLVVRELLSGPSPAHAQYGGASPRPVRNTRSSTRAL